MSIIHRALLCLFSVFVLSDGCFATATITADFDTAVGAVVFANYQEKGFVFSPSCHYDASVGGYLGTRWMGFDWSGCLTGNHNADYIGPNAGGPALLYVEHEGGVPFSLESLWFVTGPWTLSSSNGGHFSALVLPPDQMVQFSGSQWTNVNWLLFDADTLGAPVGFDHITFTILPEPSAFAILALCFAGLAIGNGRKY